MTTSYTVTKTCNFCGSTESCDIGYLWQLPEVPKYFKSQGWLVASDSARDICHACFDRITNEYADKVFALYPPQETKEHSNV